jgi:hypothetical protein
VLRNCLCNFTQSISREEDVCCVAVGVLGKSYCCALLLYSFEILYRLLFLSGRELISETANAARSTQLDARKGTEMNVRERFSEMNAIFDGPQTSFFVCSHCFFCFIHSSKNTK